MRQTITVALIVSLLTLAATPQQAALGFCALDENLDFKTAKAGDTIALHLTRDLVVNGKTLLPTGTAVSATVVAVKDGNAVSLVLDKATPRGGAPGKRGVRLTGEEKGLQDVPLMGIIAAVAAPPGNLSDDAFFSMNRSNEATQRTGNASVTSLASSGAAVQTANLEGENAPKSNLRDDSSGAIGIDGLKLDWILNKPPATTVLTAKKKNFKLPRGTEILLRMAPPRM